MRIDIWDNNEYNYKAAYGFKPNIRTFIHDEDDKSRAMMLVIPGGGYCMVTPPEGELVAKRFFDLGFDTFVLTYTTDITMSVPLKKQPLKDAVRAVKLIKDKFGKDRKLVVCGFSAGGHVVGNLITHYDDIDDPKFKDISARPDAAVFGYPVITTGEYTHIWSVMALLGKDQSQEELDYFSVEKNVTENTPPCFIWQTQTDDLVPVENSYLMAKALREKKVTFAHYVFPRGFHGLSMPCKDFFEGKAGGEYTMEQLNLAIDAVRNGKAVDVSDERQKELIAQFSEEHEMPKPEIIPSFPDIELWPELFMSFMKDTLELI